jgi:hypothetical protein
LEFAVQNTEPVHSFKEATKELPQKPVSSTQTTAGQVSSTDTTVTLRKFFAGVVSCRLTLVNPTD